LLHRTSGTPDAPPPPLALIVSQQGVNALLARFVQLRSLRLFEPGVDALLAWFV